MKKTELWDAYTEILKSELVPAMGCTEPIAVAYAGALARRELGALPERAELAVSGNIIKNVKSVVVPHTGVNALAINSGMICDGARASCAAKNASAVEAGLLGWQMNVGGSEFVGGDGIVIKGVENTIDAVSRLTREGMRETDNEILRLMMEEA